MDDNRIADRVGKAADEAKDRVAAATETATDLAGKAQTAAADAAGTIRDAAGETVRQGAQAAEYLSRSTAEQPLLGLLIAAAVGYGVAYIIHGR